MNHLPMIIAGARTPFMRSHDVFAKLMAYELGKAAVNGLIEKSNLDSECIGHVCIGSVILDPDTSNVAREIVLESMASITTPAHTVTMACISSNMAATSIVDMINAKQIDCGIAGGVETFSDLPIRLSKNLRKLLLQTKNTKGFKARLKLWSKFRPSDLSLDLPSVKEFSTGHTMGEAGDQLAARFAISRQDADAFALMSHQRADAAWRSGNYDDQVIAVNVPKKSRRIRKDDGPRPNSTPKKLAELPPAFSKFGINTAGNSSFFTDGASAIMIASVKFCEDHRIDPLASIKDYLYQAGDPRHELLLGPAFTVPHLLHRNQLRISDIDVWEIHEAFAGQVLANLAAMSSVAFCKERLGLDLKKPLVEIPIEKINLWGGSLSLGHPFGATGARLLITAAQRLIKEDGNLAVVCGCAASGLGSAVLLQREK